MSAVVIGVGNRWRRDDAAGLAVIDALRDATTADVALVVSDGEPTGLLDAFSSAGRVVLVDAMQTGAEPGTVVRFTQDALPERIGIGQSSHLISLIDTIELGKLLGKLPNGLVVIGIEGGDFGTGEGMTEAVTAGVSHAARVVLAELAAVRHA